MRKMKKLNKKGFTLIELLAVIVVLAVIMLVAVTAVVPMMNRSRKQAFITEATTFVEGAESYFIYQDMAGDRDDACVQVDELLGEYVEPKGKEGYSGKIVKEGTEDEPIYTITLYDGSRYFIDSMQDGSLANAGEDDVEEKDATEVGAIACP